MSLRLLPPLPKALFLLAGALLLAGAAPRAAVDAAAMREAMEAAEREDAQLSSAASYAHFLESRLRHHAGDSRGALEALRRARASDDASTHLQLRLAQEHARLGQWGAAERVLRSVVAEAPRDCEARVLLGRVLLESGRAAAAGAPLRRALRLCPRETSAYLALAQVYLASGTPSRAVAVVEALAAARPGEVEGLRRLGLALAQRGEETLAAPLLERVVRQAPDDAEVWRVLGRLREATGAHEPAAAAYAQALASDPDGRDTLLAVGAHALRRGQQDAALRHFGHLLSLQRDAESVLEVATVLVSQGALGAAARVLDGARAGGLRDARVAHFAGLVHEQLQAYGAAAAAFAEVPPEAPQFEEARLRRSACLARSGARAQAP